MTTKAAAFVRYAQHYLGTLGSTYWADTMQLSTYLPSYPEFLAATGSSNAAVAETLVIGEHYIPHDSLVGFMEGAAQVLRQLDVEVNYGTVRHCWHRKPWIEQRCRLAIADGVRRVLIVGAGFDTLALRLAPSCPSVTWVEVDHPSHARPEAARAVELPGGHAGEPAFRRRRPDSGPAVDAAHRRE